LVESSRKCLSESRELLARVNAILGIPPAEPAVSKVHSSQRNLLHEAMERVFDRWTDEKASPLPRSASTKMPHQAAAFSFAGMAPSRQGRSGPSRLAASPR
jgi:hypothetical protein